MVDSLDEELAGIFARQMVADLKSRTATRDEIQRTSDRVPYNQSEEDTLVQSLLRWRQEGFVVGVGPVDPDLRALADDDHFKTTRRFISQGMLFIVAGQTGCLIVKMNAGRGIFGRQKAQFICYITEGNGSYVRCGGASTFAHALMAIDRMLRV